MKGIDECPLGHASNGIVVEEPNKVAAEKQRPLLNT
jgi:hypothetical protein